MKNKFDFKDITLLPNYGIVSSRSECDTSVRFGKFDFKIPVVPANMECVIDANLAEKLAIGGYFYVMHRFGVSAISFVQRIKVNRLVSSVSIGVNEDSYNLVSDFKRLDLVPDFITIDIAHGHCAKMKRTIEFIKETIPETFIIAGNVCTPQAVIDLEEWGADSVKCGIAGGSACTTDPMTGFGNRGWQASMIEECAAVAKKPIIADGGIKRPSDITKSLVLGATMVMAGGILTGFSDSPGNLIEHDGKKLKEYWGSASEHQSGKKNRIEGKKNLIDYKDRSVFDELDFLKECLQSSISYAGGKNLDALLSVKYV